MKRSKLLVPDQVSETFQVTPIPRYEERCNVSYLDFMAVKRFGQQVNLAPCLTPINFSDTVICFQDSKQKRFKSQTFYEPRVKPRQFSDTLIVFPKIPQKSFVTCVDYHIDECRKWFKTTMEFKALTYTTNRMTSENCSNGEENGKDDDMDDDVTPEQMIDSGPGVSQVFIPRWNKEGLEDYKHPPGLVNSEVIMNGF